MLRGYKRAGFEEAWAAYLPGQNPFSAPAEQIFPSKRPNADATGTSSVFSSVLEASPDGSKTATYPTAMRVLTLGRIKVPAMARKAVLTKIGPTIGRRSACIAAPPQHPATQSSSALSTAKNICRTATARTSGLQRKTI